MGPANRRLPGFPRVGVAQLTVAARATGSFAESRVAENAKSGSGIHEIEELDRSWPLCKLENAGNLAIYRVENATKMPDFGLENASKTL